MKYILLVLIIPFILIANLNAMEYKEAPLPHYDAEKEFGWSTTVPIDKPSNVQDILKVWNVYTTRFIFVDKDKDGTCDFVFGFQKTGEKNEEGKDLYKFLRPKTCDETEVMIKNFLQYQSKN